MDRAIFTALSGAQHILDQQATNTNNLANASTTGFKGQFESFRAVKIQGSGLNSRSLVTNATTADDLSQGTLVQTGRPLDVAIQGKGWFSVMRADGKEAYTRNGSFRIDQNGFLLTSSGLSVLGDSGPITIPPETLISIADDGTISTVTDNLVPGSSNPLDRLKLTNPPENTLVRTSEGLFMMNTGTAAPPSTDVKVTSGSLESSNVDMIGTMVNMINLSRQFDVQMKIVHSLESNDSKASDLFRLT
jgi:flagellar basal-body rod protein FlgF